MLVFKNKKEYLVSLIVSLWLLIDISQTIQHHSLMKKLALSLLLILSLISPLFSEITIDYKKDELNWIVIFKNKSGTTFDAMVISANQQYRPEAGQISVEPGSEFSLLITAEKNIALNDTPGYIRLISDHVDNPGLLTLGITEQIEGTLIGHEGILLEYFYSPTCSSCREFLEREIPLLEKKLHLTINIALINISEAKGLLKMNSRLKALDSSEKKLPILIAGDLVLAGDRTIERDLENVLLQHSKGESITSKDTGKTEGYSQIKLSILPILLAGLLDGINPCAFSTLIFLLSYLTLAGRNRKQILITGLFFTTAVFLTYYIVGLGAFATLRSSNSIPFLATVLKYAMALLMSALGVIHIFDYKKVRAGRERDMTLQLSKERKRKIHGLIRDNAKQAGLFAGSLGLGIVVTIYELGCTGQVYLPTLMYMVRIEKELPSYLLLGVYNLGFIVPLIIVFIAAWKGTGSEKMARWFKKNLAAVKLTSAAFFFLMTGLLLVL